MATWGEFEQVSPALATFGAQRIDGEVAYLATVRKDGAPRVHPVTPIIGRGHLFVFMEPTSPKGHDLRRDGRYALNSSVGDSSGEGGEFFIQGIAAFVEDAEVRALAAASSSYAPEKRYVLFELLVQSALLTVYQDGRPVRQRWRER